MVLNALIWSLSFLLLAHLLKAIVPKYDKKHLFFALLISAIYPTWITMSGYAFATTAFVFVYLVALLTFLLWKPNNIISIIPHCFAVGYLYWIHPVGLAVCVASLIVIGIVSIKEKKYVSLILSALIITGFIIFHDELISKWLIETATPEGYNPYSQHYPDSERLFGKLFQYEFWMHLIAKTIGQISYLIVSSFGLILFGFITSVKKARGLLQVKVVSNSYEINIKKQALYALMALSLLGIIATGSIFFAGGSPSRFDQWIYGRYTEMVVLPLFAMGILTHWRKNWLYVGALFVFISGLILYQFADMSAENNIVNTVAFWPQYFRWENNYLYWMTASALVLVLVGRLWNDSRLANFLVILLIIICFFSAARVSRLFHQNMISTFSQPSYLEEVIRSNFESGTCIGLNPQGTPVHFLSQMQRHHFHHFYLYDYSYRRMSPDEWQQDCNGPYFTYQLDDLYEQPGIKLIGKEVLTGIYLLVKEDDYAAEMGLSVFDKSTYIARGWSIDYAMVFYDDHLEELIGPNGYFEDGSIYSSEKDGYITSGPNLRLGLGQYHFELEGEVSNANDAWIEIVSLSGNTEHGRLNIGNNKSSEKVIANGYFQLHEPVRDLEILVYAGSADKIRIDGYEIEYITEEEN